MQLSDVSNLVLIGPMAAGKTSIGKHIANLLDVAFCDTDRLIEAQQNCSIAQIFEHTDEAYFRKLETQCLKDLRGKMQHIIATGGGAVLNETNRAYIRDIGVVVYLKTDVDTIMKRTATSNSRPLLNTPNLKTKRKIISDLLDVRNPIYTQLADAIVESYYSQNKKQIALNVLNAIANCSFSKRH